jgi:membrane-associated protein
LLGALINVPASVGYLALFAFVSVESAGILVPGETSLIIAASLAAQGTLSLPIVIAVAATAAIVGDNVGYLIGRNGLRWVLDRPGRWTESRRQLLARGEIFFVRHGAVAVFIGRWLPGLRAAASWLAGVNRMPWRRFVLWNALGGISWATTIGLLAYVVGRSLGSSLSSIGVVLLGLVGLVYLVVRLRARSI